MAEGSNFDYLFKVCTSLRTTSRQERIIDSLVLPLFVV